MEFAVKLVTLILSFLFCSSTCWGIVEFPVEEQNYIEYSDGKIFRSTRNALMKYDLIKEKSDYWGRRLEKFVLGDYSEKFLVVAPLLTGKFEFNALDMNFYVDARSEESGIRYIYNF